MKSVLNTGYLGLSLVVPFPDPPAFGIIYGF
jgi:hypothetical protein